jgi:hypothetical protein
VKQKAEIMLLMQKQIEADEEDAIVSVLLTM